MPKSLKRVIFIFSFIFKNNMRNPKIYISFLLGFSCMISPMMELLEFYEFGKQPFNFSEVFIMLQSGHGNIFMHTLAIVLMLAEAPFLNISSRYMLFRTTRLSWVIGSILYGFVSIFLYYLTIFIGTLLLFNQRLYLGNLWSDSFFELTKSNYYAPYAGILSYTNPLEACFYSFLFPVLYALAIFMIFYTLNLIKGKIWGIASVVLIQVIGYVMISDSLSNEGIPKFSLLANSILIYHKEINKNILFGFGHSYILFSVIIIACFILLNKYFHGYDVGGFTDELADVGG